MTKLPASLEPDPVVEVYKKDIDFSLNLENLRLTVEERFKKLMALQRFAEELRRADKKRLRDDRL